jgi:SAM-dependent methyltransferase
MKVFGNYARYYNLLYRDKDYAGEAQFIHQLIQNHAPNTRSILELGCGTGTHAQLLAKEGYDVHGVDLSAEMLQQASHRVSQLPQELASRLTFHVFSYQTTNEDLRAAFATVKSHLKPNGVFIFDYWYGPAVLSDRPSTRVKRLEDEEISITRIAEPVMHPNQNLVDVNYQVFIKEKNTGSVEELHETHRMRYLFKPEVDLLFADSQLKLIECREWMTKREPGLDTWGVYCVGRG